MITDFLGVRYQRFRGTARGIGGISQSYYLGPDIAGIEDFHRDVLVERLVARRRAPGEDAVADGCAGAPSNFVKPPTSRISVSVIWPDNPADEQDDEPAADIYTAIWWELEDVRVENPDDAEQYVVTKRIKQVRYSRPDGTEVQLDNRPVFAAFPAS